MVFERVAHELPPEPMEIKPHPYGVELGVLLKMLKDTARRATLGSFLQSEFSRVTRRVADGDRREGRPRPRATRPHQVSATTRRSACTRP